MVNKCAVDGCDSQTRLRKGLCDSHYRNLRIYGSPISEKRKPIRERFFEKLKVNDKTLCWEWTASRNHSGYGKFQEKSGVTRAAHRVSWELAFGEIPENMFVCHKCDNPSCVNPDHLFLGTAKDNSQDRENKLRGVIGEKNCNAKLTKELVVFIRESNLPSAILGEELGVSQSSIDRVRKYKTWTKAMMS